MLTVRPLILRLPQLTKSKRLLLIAALMIFFWSFFDNTVSYLFPILMTQRGYTETQMGFIFAFSSVGGAAFDFFLSRVLKHTNYLRLFLFILMISFTFPLVLWFSNGIFLYLIAMLIWGLYYDLFTFASYDFVAHNAPEDSNTFDFGVIELFRSISAFSAPLLAAYMIIEKVEFFNVSFSLIFLIIALVLYLFLFNYSPVRFFHHQEKHTRAINFLKEFKLWKGVGRIIFPVLLFMVLMNFFDAVFWTIGPLFSQSFPAFPHFSGFLMMLYNLPSIFTVWKVEALTKRFGKKRTAFVSFLLANLFLVPVGFLHSPYLVLFFIFLSAVACSITWPSMEGALGDYVAESSRYRCEIEGLADFTANTGYIIGPILAGVLSDRIGISHAFMALGLINIAVIIYLIFTTPKSIRVVLKRA